MSNRVRRVEGHRGIEITPDRYGKSLPTGHRVTFRCVLCAIKVIQGYIGALILKHTEASV